jgi:hypothetical protein
VAEVPEGQISGKREYGIAEADKSIGMRSTISIPVILLFLVQACFLSSETEREEPVARVFEQYLYPSDLAKVIPSGTGEQDSVLLAKRYTETWVKDMLMQHRAQESLTEEQMDFESQIEEYHRSLLIYTYRQNLIQQKMDTLISEQEIQAYYEENSRNFPLEQNMIKGTFIKVPLSAPDLDQLSRWSWSNREQDLVEMEKYCISYAEKYNDFNDTWIDFSTIRDQLPVRISDPVRYLNSYRNINTSDSLFRYLVHISDHLTVGEVAPVELVQEQIKNIILNKRKIQFIKELENRVYSEGVSRNQFEIYR